MNHSMCFFNDDEGQQKYLKEWSEKYGCGYHCWKVECWQCGKEFFAMVPSAHWCSYRCRNDGYIKARKERLAKARQKVCVECSTPFVGTRSDAKFCSHSCRQRTYKRRMKVEEILPQPISVSEMTDSSSGQNGHNLDPSPKEKEITI